MYQKNKEPDRTQLSGMTREDILSYFYDSQVFKFDSDKWVTDFIPDNYKGQRLNFDLVDAKKNEIVAKSGDKLTQRSIKSLLDNGLQSIEIIEDELFGKFLADDVINEKTGEIYAEAGDEITEDFLKLFKLNNISILKVLSIDSSVGPWIRNTLALDKNSSREEALIDIYRVMRPGEPPAQETAEILFNSLFFDKSAMICQQLVE